MKRGLTLAVALVMALPLAAPTAYAQNYGGGDHRHYNAPPGNGPGNGSSDRHDGNWDPGQHNGYMWHGRWHYGRPPANVVGQRGYSAGWHQWRRGDRLPPDFRTRYVVVDDWRGQHLRPPPRGYHWVRDDRGQYILVGIATGVILSLILGAH